MNIVVIQLFLKHAYMRIEANRLTFINGHKGIDVHSHTLHKSFQYDNFDHFKIPPFDFGPISILHSYPHPSIYLPGRLNKTFFGIYQQLYVVWIVL